MHIRLALSVLTLLSFLTPEYIAVAQGPASSEQQKQLEIAGWIRKLGDESPAVRDHAQRKLELIGTDAFDALLVAQTDADLEIALRAKYLVASLDVSIQSDADTPAVTRILKDYKTSGDELRQTKLRLLATLPNDEGLSALVRLVRYEKSPLLARLAALHLASPERPRTWSVAAMQSVQTEIGNSRRAEVEWLKLAMQQKSDPAATAGVWQEIIDREAKLASSSSEDSNDEIVRALLHNYHEVLEQANETERAAEIVHRILALPAEPAKVIASIVRFENYEDWTAVKQIEDHLPDQLKKNALVLYVIAGSHKKRGNAESAQAIVKQAMAVNPNDPPEHFRVAGQLAELGYHDWAEAEFRQVMDMPTVDPRFVFAARIFLSELLYDVQHELAAAEELKLAIEAMDKDVTLQDWLRGSLFREPDSLRSRMPYFYSCHFRSLKNHAKEKEYLETALRADRTDADVLIWLYRLPNQTPEERQKVLELINEAATNFRESVKLDPDDSIPYNQYAWLIGNTEGDFAEAIEFSHRSLEIRPGSASYLDTLAHCYFGNGDFENAIRYQSQAVALEPHTLQLQRALKHFQEARDKQNVGK